MKNKIFIFVLLILLISFSQCVSDEQQKASKISSGNTAGNTATCVVLSTGIAKCWGNIYYLFTSLTPKIIDDITNANGIAVSSNHVCVLLTDGTIKCFGSNLLGELGDKSYEDTDINNPVKVKDIKNAVSIAVNLHNTCALLSDGKVKCWGENTHGELGIGSFDKPNNCEFERDKKLVCKGNKECKYNETKFSCSNEPILVKDIKNAVKLINGYNRFCVLLSDKTVKCWGNIGVNDSNVNSNNIEIKDNKSLVEVENCFNEYCSTKPYTLTGFTDVEDIFIISDNYTCASFTNNSISEQCWWLNCCNYYNKKYYANYANANFNYSSGSKYLKDIINIVEGYGNFCALLQNSTVYCWGNNEIGQLGIGSTLKNSNEPVLVPNINNAIALSSGLLHTCVLLANDEVKCWGDNTYGQLGIGTNEGPEKCKVDNKSFSCSTKPVNVINLKE